MQRIIEFYLHISEDNYFIFNSCFTFSRKSSSTGHSLYNSACIAQINRLIFLLSILKSSEQSVMTQSPQKPKQLSRRVFVMVGKLLIWKNITDLGQNRHFFPVIIIPSKVGESIRFFDYNIHI